MVNYVFNYDPSYLVAYHWLVMDEMRNRGYNPDKIWYNPNWRGKKLGEQENWSHTILIHNLLSKSEANINIYKEHNNEYLEECLNNLKSKGIDIIC